MLLEFKISNYKSFNDEVVFSLIPGSKIKGLDYSILNKKAGNKNYKALCSSVIYGPNASGKTNIIGALDTFKNIVLRGNIRNYKVDNNPNLAAFSLELIPNISNEETKPVNFYIKFIEDDNLFEYEVSIDLGMFADIEHQRKIIKEELRINNYTIFSRHEFLEFQNISKIQPYIVKGFDKNMEVAITISNTNLNPEELYLTNGFKNIFSPKLVSIITNWFSEKLNVIYRADSINISALPDEFKKNTLYVEETINEVARSFGINSNAIGFVCDSEDDKSKACSIIKNNNFSAVVPMEVFESYGTVRFINIFPIIINVILNGGILFIDEFDASLHPMALINIINIFHNNEININNAQLIFNTHNPIFLNKNIYRRDEIKFVERDDDTHYSSLYSLSDFGTSGSTSVRKNEDYMKNYFVDKYGAIKDVDFSDIICALISKMEKTENGNDKTKK